jgi:hypothetical protein
MNPRRWNIFVLFFILSLVGLGLLSRFSHPPSVSPPLVSPSKPPLAPNSRALGALKSATLASSLKESTSIEELLLVFEGNKTLEKLNASHLLAKRGESAISALRTALKSPKKEVRLWVLKTIALSKEKAFLPDLADALQEKDFALLKQTLETLRELSAQVYIDDILRFLNHPHPQIQIEVLKTLPLLGNAHHLIPLLDYLKQQNASNDPQGERRGLVFMALATLGNALLFPEIQPYLDHQALQMRPGILALLDQWESTAVQHELLKGYQETKEVLYLYPLSHKHSVAPLFSSLLKAEESTEAIRMALSVFEKEKYIASADKIEGLLVSRPDLKPYLSSCLVYLGLRSPEKDEGLGSIQGLVALFHLHRDLQDKVSWRRSQPGRGFSITLVHENPLETTPTTTNAPVTQKADERGRFLFAGLPPGNYWIEVQEKGFQPYREKVLMQGQHVQTLLEILEESGKTFLEISCFQQKDLPLEGAKVRLLWSKKTIEKTTDTEGKVQWEWLIPGEYTLEVVHPEYSRFVKTYRLDSERQSFEILLEK